MRREGARAGVRRLVVVGSAVLAVGLGASLARATYPGANGPLIVFSRSMPPCPAGASCKEVIATVHPDGSGEAHLTSGHFDKQPAWSPDGKRIVFVREYPVLPAPQLWVVNAGGGGLRLLASGLHFPAPDWIDNRRIAFEDQGSAACGGPATHCIKVLDAAGGAARRVLVLPRNVLDWAVHGLRIAYVKPPEGLYVSGLDGSGKRLVTRGPVLLESTFPFSGTGIDWSPDGRRILFATPPHELGNDRIISDLETVDIRTGALKKIPGEPWLTPTAKGGFVPANGISAPSWSPDASKMLFNIEYEPTSGFLEIPAAGGANSGTWIRGKPRNCAPSDQDPGVVEECAATGPRWQPRGG